MSRAVFLPYCFACSKTVYTCLHWWLLDTHRQVWLSLLWGHCSFLLGPCAHKAFFLLFKRLFLQFCESLIIKFPDLQSQFPWEFSLSLLDPQVGKSVVSSRTFITVRIFFSIIFLQLAGCLLSGSMVGANGDLLQGLCHLLRDLDLLQPESLSCDMPLLTLASTGDAQMQV